MNLFGTSGIRGKVFDQLTPELCLELGKAIGSGIRRSSTVAIATDTRPSGNVIKGALVSGLLATGVSVVDLGILPAPAVSFLTGRLGCRAGVMVTASHNPPEYNGIKLWKGDGTAYGDREKNQVEIALRRKKYRVGERRGAVSLRTDAQAKSMYVEELLKKTDIRKKFRVVVDPGNGAACGFAPAIFEKAGLEVLPINDKPDILPPARGFEPKEETLGGTVGYLRRAGADIAVCFDGDADRAVFCDKRGFIGYDEAIAFISRLKVLRSSRKRVVTTVEAGRLVDLAVEGAGGTVTRTGVGDEKVALAVKETRAAIGAEPNGHYIVPEVGYYSESMYPPLFLLSNIESVEEVRGFFNDMPRLYRKRCGAEVEDRLKGRVMGALVGKYAAHFNPRGVNTTDGLRLEFEDSWVLIRPSGTEPLIRLSVESESKKRARELLGAGIEAVGLAKRGARG